MQNILSSAIKTDLCLRPYVIDSLASSATPGGGRNTVIIILSLKYHSFSSALVLFWNLSFLPAGTSKIEKPIQKVRWGVFSLYFHLRLAFMVAKEEDLCGFGTCPKGKGGDPIQHWNLEADAGFLSM